MARRDAVFEVQRRLDDAVKVVKDERVAAARADLEAWAQELAATSDYRTATKAAMRSRAAGEFVIERLGFLSTDLRDRLLAALRG